MGHLCWQGNLYWQLLVPLDQPDQLCWGKVDLAHPGWDRCPWRLLIRSAELLQWLCLEVQSTTALNHPNIMKFLKWLRPRKDSSWSWNALVKKSWLITHCTTATWKKKAYNKFLQTVSGVHCCLQEGIGHSHQNQKTCFWMLALISKSWTLALATSSPVVTSRIPSVEDTLMVPLNSFDGSTVGIWIGIPFYTMVTGSLLFNGQNFRELWQWILREICHIPS